jgi:response regulator NasT
VVDLRAAMASRAVIEQAKGMIMATHHCTQHAAWRLLAGASQRHNITVRNLALALTGEVTSSSPMSARHPEELAAPAPRNGAGSGAGDRMSAAFDELHAQR